MRAVVDRIEGSMAVCQRLDIDDETEFALPISQLPVNMDEGSVLDFDGEHWALNEEETRERKRNAREWLQRLWEE